MKKEKKYEIKKDPENVIAAEVLEQAIVSVSAGVKKLLASKLKERAIILLVQDSIGLSRISKAEVKDVIDAIATLDKVFLK